MSFWPKSRYTASLELQVAELKETVKQRDATINGLIRALRGEALPGEIIPVAHMPKASAIAKDKKEPPRAGNWLRTRSALESQDQIVSEINPDKEKSANGSR